MTAASRRTTHLIMMAIVLVLSSCATTELEGVEESVSDGSPVAYLDTTIPPCTPIDGSAEDPCQPRRIAPVRNTGNTRPAHLGDELPNITEMLLGTNLTGIAVLHIVVRGTALRNTTRCELYKLIAASYSPIRARHDDIGHYNCFVDFAINEYLVGTGPPELTIIVRGEGVAPIDLDDWPEERDLWIVSLNDPRARTAAAYEGREMILFLVPAHTIAVEAWSSWGLFTKWFVQRDDADDIRAIAEEISLAETDAQRNSLDVPLATLLSQIRTAAATRTARLTTSDTDSDSGTAARSGSDGSSTTMTTVAGILRPEGGLGREKPVPVLITDANRLRDAYVEFGAIYEGEGATTVMPPPPPEVPSVPTNVGMSVEDNVVLGSNGNTPVTTMS